MKKKIKGENILSTLFIYFTIIIFSFLAILFLIKNDIFLFLLAFILLIFISLKFNIKKFPLILFVTSIVIRLIVILFMNFPQVSDAKTLLEAAQGFAIGDYSFNNLPYFKIWGYQTGFVIYEGLILKIISNPFVLKILNIIISSLLVVFVYFMSKRLTNEKTAKFVALLYMIFPYHLYMNSILLNHQLATLLMYLGILFILKGNKKIKDYIIAAVLISLGNIIRPEGIVVIFSIILFEIFKLKKDKMFDILKKIMIFLMVYFLIGNISSFAVQKLGINNEGLNNNNPKWKFVLGFNHDSCGYYTASDEKYLSDEKVEIQIIKQRILGNPIKTAKLFLCKANRFWLQSELTAKNDMYEDKVFNILGLEIKFSLLEKIVGGFNSCLYLITLLMTLIGLIIKIKDIANSNSLLFVILMTVTFGVYLLIEIQPRYAYFIHITIFILSSYGYQYMFEKVENFIKKNKKRLRKTLC